jgi:hypothetical protein
MPETLGEASPSDSAHSQHHVHSKPICAKIKPLMVSGESVEKACSEVGEYTDEQLGIGVRSFFFELNLPFASSLSS